MPTKETFEARLWAKIDRRGPDECWPWTGNRRGGRWGGYGKISRGRRGEGEVYAHRAVFELTKRRLRPGEQVRHTCDNPPCCNPAHLLAGTPKENSDDCRSRGRLCVPRGEGHPLAKLTQERADEIRRLAAGGATQRGLAAQFGVSKGAISNILRGLSWKG